MAETDGSLVARVRKGEAAAYVRLLGRHRSRLLRTCERMLGDPEAAAEVAQDAALVAWLQIDRLRSPQRFSPWLDGIGRMLCLRALRERGARHEEHSRGGSVPEAQLDAREEPTARLLAAEARAELAEAIGALPAGQREAVVLFHLADLPQAAVAARLNTSAGAVRTRLHKARAALRERLTTGYEPIEEASMPETALPARIVDIRRTPAGRHVVLLATDHAELPIWIGTPEAEALVAGLEDVERPRPRPHAHALALALLQAGGREPSAVRITRLDAAIFYAEVVLDDGTAVDARPSDALVLAVAAGVPIEIDPDVLAAAQGGAPDEYVADLAQSAEGGAALLAEELRAEIAAREAELVRRGDQPQRRDANPLPPA